MILIRAACYYTFRENKSAEDDEEEEEKEEKEQEEVYVQPGSKMNKHKNENSKNDHKNENDKKRVPCMYTQAHIMLQVAQVAYVAGA